MKTKDSVGPLINDNGYVMCDSSRVASTLSKFFVSAFSAEDTNILPLIDCSTYYDINVLSHTAFLVYYLQEAEKISRCNQQLSSCLM